MAQIKVDIDVEQRHSPWGGGWGRHRAVAPPSLSLTRSSSRHNMCQSAAGQAPLQPGLALILNHQEHSAAAPVNWT